MNKRIKLITLFLLLGMSSGCNKVEKNYSNTKILQTTETNQENETINEQEYTYKDYFDNVDIKYDLENLYPTKEDLKDVINYKKVDYCTYKNQTDCNLKDCNDIYDMIVKNTDNYVKNNPEYTDPFKLSNFNSESDEAKASKFLSTALYSNIAYMIKNSKNDIYEDICKMKDLVIVFDTISAEEDEILYAQYDHEENLLKIDFNNFVDIIHSDTDLNSIKIKQLLRHELNHVRQTPCDCSSLPYNCIRYQDSSIPFIIESSAESSTYMENDTGYNYNIDYTYATERQYELTLLLLSLFGEQNIDEYYNAIFDTDFTKLYKFLNLENENEIYKFWKIIYSYDTILLRNDTLEKYCESKNEVFEDLTFTDNLSLVGFSHELELYNMILSKMVDYTINNPNFSKSDNYEILNLVDSLIIGDKIYLDVFFESEEGIKNFQYFIDNFKKSRNKYNEFLSMHYSNENEEKYEDIDIYDRFPVLKSFEYYIPTEVLSDFFENYDITNFENYYDTKKLYYNR